MILIMISHLIQRGSKFLWWITPPAIGLSYHFSTIKAADNPNNKVDPKHVTIFVVFILVYHCNERGICGNERFVRGLIYLF